MEKLDAHDNGVIQNGKVIKENGLRLTGGGEEDAGGCYSLNQSNKTAILAGAVGPDTGGRQHSSTADCGGNTTTATTTITESAADTAEVTTTTQVSPHQPPPPHYNHHHFHPTSHGTLSTTPTHLNGSVTPPNTSLISPSSTTPTRDTDTVVPTPGSERSLGGGGSEGDRHKQQQGLDPLPLQDQNGKVSLANGTGELAERDGNNCAKTQLANGLTMQLKGHPHQQSNGSTLLHQPNGGVTGGGGGDNAEETAAMMGEEPGEDTPIDLNNESGSSSPGIKPRLTGRSLRDLDRNQRYLLVALCILYFALYALLSLIGPFFPIEAKKKGLSPLETGIVISTSWLVMFLMAPLVGFLGTKMKLYYLTTGGVATAGLVSITIGFLQYLDHREAFLALALILRIIEGVSVATFCVTAWSVLIATMGDCIQMCMAVLMAVQGVAVIVSPLLGGVLYEAGGFITPFASLGIVVVLSTPLSWWVMKRVPECSKADVGSVKKFVSNIAVFLTALYITGFSLTFKFLESYVALYIKEKFDYGPQMAGIILSLACLSFIITAVIWAQVVRLLGCVPVMVIGSILAIIVMTFIAPGHFLHYDAHPWQVFSMTCLFGVAFAASQAPAVPRLLELARKRKMPESYLTYGLVSACYNSAFDLGCFAGPLIGGAMFDYLKFSWSCFSLGVLVTVIGILMLAHHLWEKRAEKKQQESPHPEKTLPDTEEGISCQNGELEEKKKKRPSVIEISAGVVFAAP